MSQTRNPHAAQLIARWAGTQQPQSSLLCLPQELPDLIFDARLLEYLKPDFTNTSRNRRAISGLIPLVCRAFYAQAHAFPYTLVPITNIKHTIVHAAVW